MKCKDEDLINTIMALSPEKQAVVLEIVRILLKEQCGGGKNEKDSDCSGDLSRDDANGL